MSPETWNQSLIRLRKNFGDRHFPDIKSELFFDSLRHAPDEGIHEAVKHFIVERSVHKPPGLADFEKYLELFKARKDQRSWQTSSVNPGLPSGDGLADPQFVLKCRKTLADFQDKRIDKKEFIRQCDELDGEAMHFQKRVQSR